MKLVLFTHYSLLKSASMPRFARMIADGMRERGHEVEEWACPVILGNKIGHPFFAKWLGYIDQFILFPRIVRRRLKAEPSDTLFVVTDQALGPWVPLVANRAHVIHCHDFLAQRSALGEFPENPTGFTGKLYQMFIRWGYRKGRNFISVSKKTQEDLHRFLDCKPAISEVVYNGLNYPFCPLPPEEAISRLESIPAFQEIFAAQKSVHDHRQDACATAAPPATFPSTEKSLPRFILHVGGGQWYKNREGVILIYRQYCLETTNPIPLVIIGSALTDYILALSDSVPNGGKVHFVVGASNEQVHAAYVLASVFFFPSLEEGFGWPIAEAMACGCPVITTQQPPMTEVGGDAAFYIPRREFDRTKDFEWAKQCNAVLSKLLETTAPARKVLSEKGSSQSAKFDPALTFAEYAEAYSCALSQR